MGHLLGAKYTLVARYEPDGTAAIRGIWNLAEVMPVGSRWPLDPGTAMELIARTGAPGRINAIKGSGTLATTLREHGIVSAVGCPITVGPRLWGVTVAYSNTPKPLPLGVEQHIRHFGEIAAAAIANAQNYAALKASRVRILTA
jgi:GAF domain-containing protein